MSRKVGQAEETQVHANVHSTQHGQGLGTYERPKSEGMANRHELDPNIMPSSLEVRMARWRWSDRGLT